MNKLFTKIATLSVGLTMAVGVGVAVGNNANFVKAEAAAANIQGYVLASDVDDITENINGKFIIAAATSNGTYLMPNTLSASGQLAGVKSTDVVGISDYLFDLAVNNSSQFTIAGSEAYYGYDTSGTNIYYSSTESDVTNKQRWTIIEGTKGTFRIKNVGTTARGIAYRSSTGKFGGFALSNVTAGGTDYYDVEIYYEYKDSSKSDSSVSITNTKPLELSISSNPVTLNITKTPDNANITFSSTNESAATVSSQGVVTVQGYGTTTITAAFAGNDDYNPSSDSIIVNVRRSRPATITNKTISDLVTMAASDANNGTDTLQAKKVVYSLTGYVRSVDNTQYGNIHIADTNSGTGTVVYGSTATESALNWTGFTETFDFTNPQDFNIDGKITKGLQQGMKVTGVFRAFNYTQGNNTYLELDGVITNVIAKPVTGLSLNTAGTTLSAAAGSKHTFQLTPTFTPSDATDKSVTYSSGDEEVATVSNSGLITAVGVGTTTITATSVESGITATCNVEVVAAIIDATGVSLNKNSTSIVVGATETITATVEPENASNKNVTWSSSNPSVATVADGVVTAVASSGNATITVTTVDGGFTATCTVTALPKPATGVELDITSKTIQVGETLTLTPTVSPADATDKSVSWSSSNISVATVADGVVTAKATGNTTITVTTTSGGHTATCALTVRPVITFVVDEEETSVFKKITASNQLGNGDYLIVYEDDSVIFDGSLSTLDAGHNVQGEDEEHPVTISNSQIASSYSSYKFTINSYNGGYTIKSASNKYIGNTSYANALKTTDTITDSNKANYTNAIDFDDDGHAIISFTYSSGDTTLKFNSTSGENNYRFRYYKGTETNIYLYKLTTVGGESDMVIGDDLYDAVVAFNTAFTCDEDGLTFNASAWATAMSGFTAGIIETYKLSRGVAKEAKAGGNLVEEFLAKYDYVIGFKKAGGYAGYTGLTDVLNRFTSGGINYSSGALAINTARTNDNSIVLVVTVIAAVSTLCVGGFFFIRKKKNVK